MCLIQSPVMSVSFSKFHPNYVIGGTYSGQVVLWDTRSGKRTPIQRSPISSSAHTHPIYCLDVVGSQNAHNLISVSTDGKMCSWNLDMLSQPQVGAWMITKVSYGEGGVHWDSPLPPLCNNREWCSTLCIDIVVHLMSPPPPTHKEKIPYETLITDFKN